MSESMTAPPIVHFTPRAIERAKNLLVREDKPGHGLRLGVRGGGCSGLNYFVAPENLEKKGDLLLDFDGLRVYLDVKSQLFLIGTEVDWEDGILSSGFRFHNPNAKRSCSCGESFTV
jgi:iron-sulfur cluster assembly protein